MLPIHQTFIINSIADISQNIGSNFSKTIFNDIKREKFPDVKGMKTEEEFAQFIAKENEKLIDVIQ